MKFTIKDQERLDKLVYDMWYAPNEKDGLKLSNKIVKNLKRYENPPEYYYRQITNYQVDINLQKWKKNQ